MRPITTAPASLALAAMVGQAMPIDHPIDAVSTNVEQTQFFTADEITVGMTMGGTVPGFTGAVTHGAAVMAGAVVPDGTVGDAVGAADTWVARDAEARWA